MTTIGTMEKKVNTKDLKVGMFINLGGSWLSHSFLRPAFKLHSDKQIAKIIKNGFRSVMVDLDRSDPAAVRELEGKQAAYEREYASVHNKPVEVPVDFNPMEQISDELREAIEDHKLPPRKKAEAVYAHSIRMMDSILQKPSAENILSGKKIIYTTVDHILADDDTADALSQITSHDYYTYTHSVNVGLFSVLLAKEVFKDGHDHNMQELGAGFFLHDLGKCDVPADLINKPDRLTPDEWQVMRDHPSKGNKLLADAKQLTRECGVIVMQHHEREDGSGYPLRLSHDEIHLYGRICSIADVYDALTSTRAYKKKLPPFDALAVMKNEMFHHFNRELFGSFVTLFA